MTRAAALLPLLLITAIVMPRVEAQSHQGSSRRADIIFLNGDVFVGSSFVEQNGRTTTLPPAPRVQAIAVADGRIVAVGTNEQIRKLRDKKTSVVDLGGHFTMPGFNDAHLHLANGGFEKLNLDLVGVHSLAEMQQRISTRVRQATSGEWIIGRGWDHTTWPGAKLPSRQDLDSVTAEHPAIFVRVDGHIAIANSAALQACGVGPSSVASNGGQIDRDLAGQPTGILREGAQELVFSKVPKPTVGMRRKAAELALADAARWGITSAQDNSEWDDFLVYEDLEREGKLTLRISEWLPFSEPLDVLQAHRAHHSQTDPMLRTGMLKAFMDGSLGSRTAALLASYSDDPKNSGLPQYRQNELNQMARQRVSSGFQLGFHAIGDAAVRMALNAFEDANTLVRDNQLKNFNTRKGTGDFRYRVEHAQVISPTDFSRFANTGVIASMQPNHLLTDMNWAEERLGSERSQNSYAWRKFLDSGVHLAFGTDYPVEPITPFRGIYSAVTRKNEAGTKSYFPEQKLNINEAIAAYTTGAAYAEFAEDDKGRIAAGMLADFVVLDRDITKVQAAEILGTQVLRTVVGGMTVYSAPAGKRN